MRTSPPSPDRIDLTDPDLYLDGPPHEIFARLRRDDPVHWSGEVGGSGSWSITRYADIVHVSRRPELFSSDRQHGGHRLFDEAEVSGRDTAPSLISMDPPEHTHHRRVVAPLFGAERIARLERSVRRRAATIVEGLGERGEDDFVHRVAAELPLQVLADLFGIPAAERHRLYEWSDAVIAEDDPEMRASREHVERCDAEMAEYALELRAERLERPGDDLVSYLVHRPVDGAPMSLEQYVSTFVLFLVAGNETTRNAISGGLEALSAHPDERRRLLAHPELMPRAVNEIVRWISPVLHMRRTAVRDTLIDGREISAGQKVVLWYVSANRDEELFDHPDRFDVGRQGPPHLGFGIGPHFCIGSRLAELEIRVLFEELLARRPEIEVCGPVRRVRSNFIHGIKEMPVRWGHRRSG